MALYSTQHSEVDDGWLASINTTPLVDVMLVLLIIFLITIPVVSASVNVNLPVESAQWQDTSGDYVVVSVDRVGNLYFNDTFDIADREVHRSVDQDASLFMRMRVQRHLGAVRHFKKREHEMLAEGRPHLAARHGPDRWIITKVNEAHSIPVYKRLESK